MHPDKFDSAVSEYNEHKRTTNMSTRGRQGKLENWRKRALEAESMLLNNGKQMRHLQRTIDRLSSAPSTNSIHSNIAVSDCSPEELHKANEKIAKLESTVARMKRFNNHMFNSTYGKFGTNYRVNPYMTEEQRNKLLTGTWHVCTFDSSIREPWIDTGDRNCLYCACGRFIHASKDTRDDGADWSWCDIAEASSMHRYAHASFVARGRTFSDSINARLRTTHKHVFHEVVPVGKGAPPMYLQCICGQVFPQLHSWQTDGCEFSWEWCDLPNADSGMRQQHAKFVAVGRYTTRYAWWRNDELTKDFEDKHNYRLASRFDKTRCS